MKITKQLNEANVFRKLEKDPLKMKMLSIAMKHDGTLPIATMGRLGPKPTPEQYAKTWSDMLDDELANTPTGNYSRDGKFDDWLTKLYIDQDFDWEDLSGQAIDALATWKALSNRNILEPQDKDFNKFRNLKTLQAVVRKPKYAEEVQRWKEKAQIDKMKAEREELPLIDNDRYYVSIPFNYGACYYIGHIGGGMIPTWCTSSSSGAHWAKRYIDQGLMFNVLDKKNMGSKEGKFQVHGATGQIKNGDQSENSDKLFSELFPGLMKKIVSAIKKNSGKIEEMSKKATGNEYDINKEIDLLKAKFPLSWASVPPEDEEEAEADSEEAQEIEKKDAQAAAQAEPETDDFEALYRQRAGGEVNARPVQWEVLDANNEPLLNLADNQPVILTAPTEAAALDQLYILQTRIGFDAQNYHVTRLTDRDVPRARNDVGQQLAAVAADQVAGAEEQNNNDGPGLYRLTFGNRSVQHNFQSREDARQQVLQRNPNIDIDQVEIVRIGDRQEI